MAEAVVKDRATEEVRPRSENAYSDHCRMMAEAVAKEQETVEVKPVFRNAKPIQMAEAAAAAKERETEEIKPLGESAKPDHTAEAVAKERETRKVQPFEPRYVAIKVKSQDGVNTFFKIGRDTELKKLLIAYCPSTRFFINGNRFNRNEIADDIGLEDETEIEAMIEALGGGDLSFSWI